MKGKVVFMIKKWWVIVLVFTLALSLTSCAKRKKELLGANYGFAQCDGNLGNFDVYVIRSESSPTNYDLSIVPAEVNSGDIASIYVANNRKGFRQLVQQVVLYPDEEINLGLTEADLNQYKILAISAYDPSIAFHEQSDEFLTYCQLPLPGDGVAEEDLVPQN